MMRHVKRFPIMALARTVLKSWQANALAQHMQLGTEQFGSVLKTVIYLKQIRSKRLCHMLLSIRSLQVFRKTGMVYCGSARTKDLFAKQKTELCKRFLLITI